VKYETGHKDRWPDEVDFTLRIGLRPLAPSGKAAS
jgi:hypothetical protein